MNSLRRLSPIFRRTHSTTAIPPPSWSVRALLPGPPGSPTETTPTISPNALSHLLRLSALSSPADPASLRNHLHFVRSLVSNPTTSVAPLDALRDEVNIAPLEYTYEDITSVEEELDFQGIGDGGSVAWTAVAGARRRVGGYFVVDEAVEDKLARPENEE